MSRGKMFGGVALAAAAAMLGVTLARGTPKPPAYSSSPAALTAPTTNQVRVVPVATAMQRLSGQPLTVAVVGDSTGAGTDRWVYRVAGWLATRSGRPVHFHPWDDTGNQYAATITLPGSGTPIEVYNGSASGMASAYSLHWLPAVIPVRPDLVIINHGHNEAITTAAAGVDSLIVRLRAENPQAAFAVIAQNPEIDPTETQDQDARVDAIRRIANAEGVEVIDVHAAFENQPDMASLYQDDRHPNSAGSALWADIVEKALG